MQEQQQQTNSDTEKKISYYNELIETEDHDGNENKTYFANEKLEINPWLLDSGSSVHICRDKSQFDDITFGHYGKVRGGKGESSQIEGIGTVILKPNNKSGYGKFELKNVYFVPGFNVNLISVGAIRDQGTVIFNKSGGEIQTAEGELVCTFKTKGRMTVLDAEPVRPAKSFFTEEVKGDLAIWHARFGHASYNAVKEAQKMTKGMILEATSERPPVTSAAR